MYNEEQKLRFINKYTKSPSTVKTCVSVFDAYADLEGRYGKDLCQIDNAGDLQEIVSAKFGIRARSAAVRISILRAYCRWCKEIGVQNVSDAVFSLAVTTLSKIGTRTVSSPEHLQAFLDTIYTKEWESMTDNLCRAYYWLAYMGIPESIAINITASDVDIDNEVVKAEGKTYKIYGEAIACVANCKELHAFRYEHPGYNEPIWRDRYNSDKLLRGIKTDASSSTLKSRASKDNNKAVSDGKTNIRLSYYRAWLSGLFYRMHCVERSGEELNFRNAAIDMLASGKYGNSDNDPLRVDHSMVDLKKDYIAWKEFYGLE